MVGKEILDGVYEFIKNNPNCNQSDIVRGMEDVCTRLPVLDAIRELTSHKDGQEPKVKFSRNTLKGFYHYYVNDKNEFNYIIDYIDKVGTLVDKFGKLILKSRGYAIKEKTTLEWFERYFPYMTNFGQLIIYRSVTGVANTINEYIKSANDRETLYLKLVQVLTASDKINKVISPAVTNNLRQMIKELDDSKKGDFSDEMLSQIHRITDIAESLVEFLNPNLLDEYRKKHN